MRIAIVLILAFLISFSAQADLRPYYLDIKISADRRSFSLDEVIPFWITFTNTSKETFPYILPGNTRKQKKVLYFSFFSKNENNFYTEVYRESELIEMDSSQNKWSNMRNLDGGQSFTFPVFFNDERNYPKVIEAHHRVRGIPPGKYEVLAWYKPFNDELADQLYDPIDAFGEDISEHPEPYKLDMPLDGLQSHYFSIEIVEKMPLPPVFIPTAFCPKDCSYCGAIENENWPKVEDIIDKQTHYEPGKLISKVDSTWRQDHRNVAWLGPDPEAILSSLPAWTGRTIIYKNSEGYHYYYLSWQIGKVYKARSRASSFFHWIGFRKSPIKSSELDYYKLVAFTRR